MNTQERDQLSRFLQQLTEVKLTAKDQEAAAMISEAASRQPDAIYLLVQRAMLLDQALNAAKSQISNLQQQLQAGAVQNQSGFLNSDPWTQAATQSAAVPGAGNYQVPRPMPQQPQPQASGFMGGAGSSFLGNVATTAAGVVAGSFLFQGIENLLGHHSPSSWGGQVHNMPGETVTEEYTTINNYYGDDATPSDVHTASYDSLPTDDDDTDFGTDNDSDSNWI